MAFPTDNTSLADYYFGFLENLNSDSKLDLISKLSQSLKNTENVAEVPLSTLFGAYRTEQTADEIIDDLRTSKVFTRNIEAL